MADDSHSGQEEGHLDSEAPHGWVKAEVLNSWSEYVTEESVLEVQELLCHPADKGSALARPVTLGEAA